MLRSADLELKSQAPAASRSKAKRRNLLPWLLVPMVLLGGGLGLRRVLKGTTRPVSIPAGSALLADGTYVRLAQASFGRAHRLGPPPSRFTWLAEPLSDWLTGRRTDTPTLQASYPSDHLVLWLTRHLPSQPRRTAGMERWLDYQLVDSHGCRFDEGQRTLRTEGKNGSFSSSSSRGRRFSPPSTPDPTAFSVGLASLTSFPRREPTMALRLFGDGWGEKVELVVNNPVPSTYPEWTPEGLPAKQTDGDLTARLTEVTGRLNRWASHGFEERRQELKPKFEISHNGRRSDEWVPGDLQLSDATGNTVPAWDTRLCTLEKAWKLRARFWRKPLARYSSEEVWVRGPVTLPATGAIHPLSGTTTIQGVKLELLAVAGRGSFRYKNGVPSKHEQPLEEGYPAGNVAAGGSSTTYGNGVMDTDNHVQAGQPHVGVKVEGLRDDQHLDLVAIDARGRKVTSERTASIENERYFALDLPKDAHTVRLHFMVHRCRTAEFLIQPPTFKN